jgi:ubiquitin conjugation factor E4 B
MHRLWPGFRQIDRIDSDYYRHSKRVDIKEETKMRAAQDEANEYYSEDDMQTEREFAECALTLMR